MKKLSEISKQKISLNGLDEKVIEKLNNLNGQIITECCCNCYCNEPKCCSTELCCNNSVPNYPIKYYNEQQIITKLETDVTVQDILAIEDQFNMGGRYIDIRKMLDNSPIYFEEKVSESNGFSSILFNSSNNLQSNKQVYNFINSLIKKFGLVNPIVYSTLDGRNIIYFIKHTGTNGKEGSIKNSLLEIYNLLNDIEEYDEVSSCSCSNISIDSCDDVYAFLIRISLDKMFIINPSK